MSEVLLHTIKKTGVRIASSIVKEKHNDWLRKHKRIEKIERTVLGPLEEVLGEIGERADDHGRITVVCVFLPRSMLRVPAITLFYRMASILK